MYAKACNQHSTQNTLPRKRDSSEEKPSSRKNVALYTIPASGRHWLRLRHERLGLHSLVIAVVAPILRSLSLHLLMKSRGEARQPAPSAHSWEHAPRHARQRRPHAPLRRVGLLLLLLLLAVRSRRLILRFFVIIIVVQGARGSLLPSDCLQEAAGVQHTNARGTVSWKEKISHISLQNVPEAKIHDRGDPKPKGPIRV